MADTKISGLTNSTNTPADTDAFVTVESMGTVPATYRKAWSTLKTAFKATISSQMLLFGASATIDTTNGATVGAKIELGTNKQNLNNYPSFGTASKSYVEWDAMMPGDYGAGAITAEFVWTSPGTALGTVIWGLQGRAYADGNAIDQAWGTAQEISDVNQGSYTENIAPASASITLAGAPTAGCAVRFRAYRDGTVATNSLGTVALLKLVRVTYTRA
jgi:hypothetical protein